MSVERELMNLDLQLVLPRGLDVLGFVARVEDWHLREHVGLAGIREIKEQLEFEDEPAMGNA